MTSRRRAITRGIAITLLVVGAVATGWFVYTDTFGGVAAVLCTDPEDWACSGHYVHGVANEVWTVAITVSGVVGLLVARPRRQTTASHRIGRADRRTTRPAASGKAGLR